MKKWALPLGVSLSGTLLWWLHRVLTNAFPPFDNTFDTALWVTCSALKLLTVICIPIALGRVFVHCHKNPGKTAVAAAVWGLALVLLLVTLSLIRAPLITQLNDECSKFFPNSMDKPVAAASYAGIDLQDQVARWQHGIPFLMEFGLVVGGVLLLGLLAFYVGKTGFKAGIASAICLGILFLTGSLVLKLLIWDYDMFFAGTMIAPLSIDIITPYLAVNPTTEIGFLVYTTIIWASWLLDSRLLSKRKAVTGTGLLSIH